MSYILEALQRAQAQREQGHVPGLNAQPLPQGGAPHESRWRLWWIGAVVLVAGATLSGLLLWKRGVLGVAQSSAAAASGVRNAAPVQSVTITPGAGPTPAAPTPASVASAPSPFVTGAVGGVAATAPALPPQPAPPIAAKPIAAPAVKPQSPPAPAPVPLLATAPPTAKASAPASSGTAAPAPATKTSTLPVPAPAVPTSTAAEPSRIYTQAELPEDVRRDLPKLAVTGSVYSSNPAQRMLVLNGQVMQEGGSPGGDVVLEQIRPKSAVLRFRGYRYSLDF